MAIDAFLYVDGVQGEATAKGFEGWIEILSFSFGASNAANIGSGTGGGAGKVRFQELKITKASDKSSAKLWLACCNGTHTKTGKLYCRKAGGTALQYLKYELSTLFCTSYNIGASGDEEGKTETPVEELTFVYGALSFTYTPQKADGSADAAIVTSYDIKTAAGT